MNLLDRIRGGKKYRATAEFERPLLSHIPRITELPGYPLRAVGLKIIRAKAEEMPGTVIDEIAEAHGILHVLYNHAGTPGAAGLDASVEEWDTTVEVNMRSAYYATSYALDLLRKAEGKGSIIYTSSVSGLAGSPFSPLYSMAKHGIVGLVRATALALAPEGIRCNAICPSSVATPMLRGFLDRNNEGLSDEQMEEFVKRTVPLGRAAQPEEIANAALFLACDESSFITGVPLPVDGGFTAR